MTTPEERTRLRAEVLDAIGPVLLDGFAAREWGRLLVRVERASDGVTLIAKSADVEEIVGDERRVDAAFAAPEMRHYLPALAEAVDALCDTFDVDAADVEGGTFLRLQGDAFAFLPGLISTPSDTFEKLRDEANARVAEKNARWVAVTRTGAPRTHFDVDFEEGRMTFFEGETPIARARAVLLGTFASRARMWVYAWAHPSIPESMKEPSRAACDAVSSRDMWEISTPQFQTDEETAWHLAAIVAEASRAEGVFRIPRDDGNVYLLLHDVERA